MRALFSIVTFTLSSAALVACTVETKTTGGAPTQDAGVTRTGDKEGASTGKPLGGKTTPTRDAGTSAEPSGDAPTTCRAAAECLGDCGDGDDACQDACLASLPEGEMAELADLATCIQNSTCTDMECLEAECAAEFQTCAGE
jgi:hypothetical protein